MYQGGILWITATLEGYKEKGSKSSDEIRTFRVMAYDWFS